MASAQRLPFLQSLTDEEKKSKTPATDRINALMAQRQRDLAERGVVPTVTGVVAVQHVIEVEGKDPKPNAFYDPTTHTLRAYHGSAYGSATDTLSPAAFATSPSVVQQSPGDGDASNNGAQQASSNLRAPACNFPGLLQYPPGTQPNKTNSATTQTSPKQHHNAIAPNFQYPLYPAGSPQYAGYPQAGYGPPGYNGPGFPPFFGPYGYPPMQHPGMQQPGQYPMQYPGYPPMAQPGVMPGTMPGMLQVSAPHASPARSQQYNIPSPQNSAQKSNASKQASGQGLQSNAWPDLSIAQQGQSAANNMGSNPSPPLAGSGTGWNYGGSNGGAGGRQSEAPSPVGDDGFPITSGNNSAVGDDGFPITSNDAPADDAWMYGNKGGDNNDEAPAEGTFDEW